MSSAVPAIGAAMGMPLPDPTKVWKRYVSGHTGSDPNDQPGGAPPIDPAKQFDTRRQNYANAASAASVSRSDNDADLLGFVGTRRPTGAARKILGD